jgi:hypothetical protein
MSKLRASYASYYSDSELLEPMDRVIHLSDSEPVLPTGIDTSDYYYDHMDSKRYRNDISGEF